MKILHCADIHLDSAMTANLDKDKARERRSELLASFKDMVGYAVKAVSYTHLTLPTNSRV